MRCEIVNLAGMEGEGGSRNSISERSISKRKEEGKEGGCDEYKDYLGGRQGEDDDHIKLFGETEKRS